MSSAVHDINASDLAELPARFASFLTNRGISRRHACVYMGMHPNTLNRLSDQNWGPSHGTLVKMASFMARFRASDFAISGDGWRLTYDPDEMAWYIDAKELEYFGPYSTPDAALSKAHRHLARSPIPDRVIP